MPIQNVNVSTGSQVVPPVRLAGDGAPKAASNATAKNVAAGQGANGQVAAQQPSSEQLKSAVDVINQVLRQSNHSLEFSVDNDTGKPVVKLTDTETGELIRQFPSEETLAISRAIDRFQQGMLLKQQA